MPDAEDFIAIGKITKPIGLKGNVKVVSLSDFPDRFQNLRKVKLFDEKENVFLTNKATGEYDFQISHCRNYDAYLNVKFTDVDDIESADVLRNKIMMIGNDERVKLKKGQHYFFDLIGCQLFNNGNYIGDVASIVNYGSGDLFSVKKDDKEILIPFNDEFVRKIDTESGRIDVQLIEGFL